MKFTLEWLSDFVDTAAAGGPAGVRALLDRAGFPVESVEGEGAATILDVEITPNRPDAMSHRGLAREIAAMAGLALLPPPQPSPSPPGAGGEGRGEGGSGSSISDLASVTIEVPRLCRRFGARVVSGISGAPAPSARAASRDRREVNQRRGGRDELRPRGNRPAAPRVRPRQLAGRRIVVRRGAPRRKLVTLDGIERDARPADIVVADAERASRWPASWAASTRP
jgi:phenylalanyl-tRNA synthetase beta chain